MTSPHWPIAWLFRPRRRLHDEVGDRTGRRAVGGPGKGEQSGNFCLPSPCLRSWLFAGPCPFGARRTTGVCFPLKKLPSR